MNLNCPHCGQVLDCPDELLEKSVTCFNCQKSFITEIPDDQKESPILKRVIALLLLAVGILIAAPKIYMSYYDIFLRPETERILKELEESMLKKELSGLPGEHVAAHRVKELEDRMRRDAREEILQATMPEEIPYENAKYGFSIVFPEGWEISPGAAEGTIVKSVYRGDQGKFAMLTVSAYAEKEEFDAWYAPRERIFQKMSEDFPGIQSEILGSGKSIIDVRHAFWLMYKTTEPLDLDGVYMVVHSVYIGKTNYQITEFSNDRSLEVANVPKFRAAIDSLRFTAQTNLAGKRQ